MNQSNKQYLNSRLAPADVLMASNAKELRSLLTNEVKMAAAAAAAAAASTSHQTAEESARQHFQHFLHRHPLMQDFMSKHPVV